MTRRDRWRVVQVALIATLFLWGLFAGMTAGSKYQEDTNSPFSDVAAAALAALVAITALLAIAPLTRDLAKVVGVSAVAFTLAVLLGHLLGNKGLGGPEVPRGSPSEGRGR
jgi:hydrogenase-4 membrane subunit HyfE